VKLFNKKMSMEEFAFAVAQALEEKGIQVILTGGAVVSIYSEGKYVSKDLDFLSPGDHQLIKKAMIELGFENEGKDFFHKKASFSVEFPGYDLVIGDEPMKPEGKLKEANSHSCSFHPLNVLWTGFQLFITGKIVRALIELRSGWITICF